MSLLKKFKEWLNDHQEREQFEDMWRTEHHEYFRPRDHNAVNYHLNMAFLIYKQDQKIDELERKLENL